MAKVRVTNVKTVTHGGVQIEGLRELSWDLRSIEKKMGSDGGPAEVDVTDFEVSGEAAFENVSAYNAAIAADEGDLVVLARTEGGGTDRRLTLKNCKFGGTRGSLPSRSDQNIGTYRCSFRLNPGPSDGPEDMIDEAAAA